jgi:TolA-binding protein
MNDLEQLIRYLDGELTEEQKILFQEQLKNNHALTDNLEIIQDINQILGDKQIATFEDNLKEVEHVLFRNSEIKKERATSHYSVGRRLAIAGAISLLIIGCAYFLFFKTTASYTDELYAQYYSKLDANFFTRSDAPAKDDFIQAIQLYDAGDYKAAIMLFNKILTNDPSNNAVKLFLGICYSETQRFPNAIKILQGVIAQNDLTFGEHATWYLSLCYIKTKDIQHAKQTLKQLISSKSYYVEKASELLQKLP